MTTPFAVIDLEAFSCRHRVVVDASADVARIERFTRATLDRLDRAASRFRHDSELFTLNTRSRQAAAHGEGRFETELSVFLAAAMRAALRTAALTDGLVVPHLGRQIVESGYDTDITAVRRAGDEWPYRAQAKRPRNGTTPRARPTLGVRPIQDKRPTLNARPMQNTKAIQTIHRAVTPVAALPRLGGPAGRTLSMQASTALDLGGSAKAWCADILAHDIAAEHHTPVLVSLGGDVATAGPRPAQGWSIAVNDAHGHPLQHVGIDGACATSSTMLRRWRRGGHDTHHIIDPRTGRSAVTPWAQVSAAGPDAVQANAASTAAVVLGDDAPAWLERRGVPALLQHRDGSLVRTSGWAEANGLAA